VTRVGMVTSWACRCGIAEYSRSLLASIPAGRFDFYVLADEVVEGPDDTGLPVERCWRRSSDDVSGILEAVERLAIELVVIEFNWGYLNPRPLGALLSGLRGMSRPAIVQMHSTEDRALPGPPQSIADAALQTARAVIVHSDADENRIRRIAPGAALERAVLGQSAYADEPRADVRFALGIADRTPVLASFGFLLPHKGVLEVIRAMPLLLKTRPGATFLAVCSLVRSMPASVVYWHTCLSEVRTLGLGDSVALLTDFLPEEAVMTLLHASDAVLLPYLDTQESASASARFALSSRRPVLTSRAPIFDPLGDAVFRFDDTAPASIVLGVERVLGDPMLRESLLERAAAASADADWTAAGRRFADLLASAVASGGAQQAAQE
jgi:glycosyltransferase involved in cell wall biosynthesis